MAGGFANFGLNAEGMDTEQAMSQENALRGQKVTTGQIGLEDLQREQANQATYRGAVSGSDPNQGTAGMIRNVQSAAKSTGDLGNYQRAQQALIDLRNQGWSQVTMAALTGAPPDQAEKDFNATGTARMVPGSLEYGRDPNTGDILMRAVNADDGKEYHVNATQYARLHGMLKTETEALKPGEKLINKQTGAQIANNPPLDMYDVSRTGIIFNKHTGSWQQTDTSGEWKLGTVVSGTDEIPVELNTRNGEIHQLTKGGVRTGLEAKISQSPGGATLITFPGGKVGEFRPETAATPGKTHMFGADEPGTPGQPAGVNILNPDEAPVPGAQKAPDGNWYVKQGNGWAKVVMPGQAQAAPGPAAQTPSGQPGPAPAAAPAPAAPPMRPVTPPTPEQAATVNPGPVVQPPPVQQVPQGLEGGQPSPGMRPIAPPLQPVEAGNRVPIVGAGLDTLAAGRRALIGGTQQIDQVLVRGAPMEKEDANLRSAGNLIRAILKNPNSMQNPDILRGAVQDYQTRLDALERIRGTQ
jgi:hypothetical protein